MATPPYVDDMTIIAQRGAKINVLVMQAAVFICKK
jgi:hypothetical protein